MVLACAEPISLGLFRAAIGNFKGAVEISSNSSKKANALSRVRTRILHFGPEKIYYSPVHHFDLLEAKKGRSPFNGLTANPW